jgi:hypothetical protein
MPSLNLTHWREECLQFARQVDRPREFQSSLRAAFASHSHRLLRPGPSLAAQGALPSWNVPAIMVQELQAALAPVFRELPAPSLALADLLWEKGYYEERVLAVFILQVAADPDQVLSRISDWNLCAEGDRIGWRRWWLSGLMTDRYRSAVLAGRPSEAGWKRTPGERPRLACAVGPWPCARGTMSVGSRRAKLWWRSPRANPGRLCA